MSPVPTETEKPTATQKAETEAGRKGASVRIRNDESNDMRIRCDRRQLPSFYCGECTPNSIYFRDTCAAGNKHSIRLLKIGK